MSRCIQSQLYIQDKIDGELCSNFVTENLNFSETHLSFETQTPLIWKRR